MLETKTGAEGRRIRFRGTSVADVERYALGGIEPRMHARPSLEISQPSHAAVLDVAKHEADATRLAIEDQIQSLYSVEIQLTEALPRMADRASAHPLKEAFAQSIVQTRRHVDRLTFIASILAVKPFGGSSHTMHEIIKSGNDAVGAYGDDSAMIDATLISAARCHEQFQVMAYGTMLLLAMDAGDDRIIVMLQDTIREECAADATFTRIAGRSDHRWLCRHLFPAYYLSWNGDPTLVRRSGAVRDSLFDRYAAIRHRSQGFEAIRPPR